MSTIRITAVEGEGSATRITFTLDDQQRILVLGRDYETTSKMSLNELELFLHHKAAQQERYKPTRPSITRAVKAFWSISLPLREDRRSPPRFAELLFSWLAPKKTLHEQLGDLQEIFELNVARFGKSRAGMLYWTQVLRAVGPGVWRRVKKLGLIGILIDYGRSKIGW